MALVKEYFELTKKYQNEYGENTIVLMQVGSFMECYGLVDKNTNSITGSKIQDFSRICELNIAEKHICIGKDNVVMAGVTVGIVEKLIRKIQDAGYTCVVYTQDENNKNTTRSLAGIFSPGTYFQNETTNLTNNITCIWIDLFDKKLNIGNLPKGKYITVGISNIDIYTSKSSVFQFTEPYTNNPTNFDELERFISIYNPSEVIIISNMTNNQIDNVINYSNIQCKLIHKFNTDLNDNDNKMLERIKNCEKQTYQKEILQRFFVIDDYESFKQNFSENNYACQSYCFLLDFIFQHNPYLVKKISEPIFENCSERLILANHSLKQLNIIDDNNYNGKYSSVVKMLNACITPMGKRKFNYDFLNPTTNITYLQTEYDITDYILQNFNKYDFIKQKLLQLKDIAKWNRQIILKKISPFCFYNLYNNLTIISEIYKFVKSDKTIMTYLNNKILNCGEIDNYCTSLKNFITENLNIESCKDVDQIQNFEVNFINKGIDNELDNKNLTLIDSSDKLEAIRVYFNNILANCEKKSKTTEYFKIHETEKNSFSLIGTKRRCVLLREEFNKINKNKINIEYISSFNNEKMNFDFNYDSKSFELQLQSTSNNSIFTPQINELCKNISNIKIQLKDILNRVYGIFIEKFEDFREQLEIIIQFVTYIDIIFSKASIAKKYSYCKPVIDSTTDKSFVNIKGLRHCLIEHLQQNELYVTNDLDLGDGKIDGLLLYGTNAVGKTSFIRALGISVIMAQSGLYVPASQFTFNPYTYIFTRILGNDNIFKGLSSFAVEMSELRSILRLSNKNSLVLGDELCSGTESISAISIFVAGIQKLIEGNSSFIFATHLHEIVNYDEITSMDNLSIKHMTVIYDKERDLLIYDRKLKDGPGDNMYGLEVCKSLNLPEDFLEKAHDIRMKYHPEKSSILSLKNSHFNSKKVMGLCEKCGSSMGKEVHHLIHQSEANNDGIIESNIFGKFNKNHTGNLMTLCEDCHNNIHKDKKQHKKVKTTKGYAVVELS